MGILQWLFGGDDEATDSRVDDAVIDHRIEQIVNMIDPRLKLVTGYRGKLAEAVTQAVLYCRELEAKIPASITASAAAWPDSPLLRALFATAPDVPTIFSRSGAVQEFFEATPGADAAYAGVRFVIREEQRFGMRVQGEVVQRDVAQTAVSFGDKKVPLAVTTEREIRTEIRRRAFKFLITEALDQITSANTRREDLTINRTMLKARLDMLRRHRGSMESVLEDGSEIDTKVEALEELLALNARSLAEFPTAEQTLEYILKRVKAVLTHGAQYIQVKPVTLRLDPMNIVVPAGAAEPANEIVLPEVSVKGKPSLSLIVACFPRGELIPRASLADEARRLLG